MYFIGNSYIPYFDIHQNQVTRDTIPDLLTLMNKSFSHIAEGSVLVMQGLAEACFVSCQECQASISWLAIGYEDIGGFNAEGK